MTILDEGTSITIPTWNNLVYLKLCIESLKKHSRLDHEILVHVSDGSDGSLDYVREQGLKYTHSEENIGLCKGTNACAAMASKPTVCYINDDMCVLPGWDTEMCAFMEANRIPELFWGCSMMIEPNTRPRGTPSFLVGRKYDFGRTADTYDEARLVAAVKSLQEEAPQASTQFWPPSLLPTYAWEEVGGLTEDYDDVCGGLASDPDLALKMWNLGCRNFFSVPRSLTYHFGSRSTSRITNCRLARHLSRRLFAEKHGMSIDHFTVNILHRGELWDKERFNE